MKSEHSKTAWPSTALTLALAGMVLALLPSVRAEHPHALAVDFGQRVGRLRPLHGLNKGPLASGGLVDLTPQHRALGVPSVRVHDCGWPNPDVVDIHTVFPDFAADPESAASYHFPPTDEYLAAIRGTGAEIVFRLGESIEHRKTKRFVHPPPDPEKWAAVCLGLIRHYNEGWAGGFRHGIRYWEIWNEPENRPAMWTGTDADYFHLYKVTARAIRRRYPELKVGGPAVGNPGQLVQGEFRPSAFVTAFLDHCRQESLPLDFFSWHCYTDDPGELSTRARAIRQLLDDRGFPRTESHLNEWNYLPGNDWSPWQLSGQGEARRRCCEEMTGAPGAAFIATALLELQDAPVDVCNFYHGELGAFGLFNEHGEAMKNYHAFRAFRALLATPQRVRTQGGIAGQLAVAAGLSENRSEAAVLISNYSAPCAQVQLVLTNLPWTGQSAVEVRRLDARHNLSLMPPATNDTLSTLKLDLSKPAVILIQLRPAGAERRTNSDG